MPRQITAGGGLDTEDVLALSSIGDTFSDIALKVEDRTFKSHRVILYIMSPVFKALLTNGFKESQPGVQCIDLPDDDPDTFQAMYEYFYSRDYKRTSTESLATFHMRVAVLADKYGVPGLKRKAEEKVRSCDAYSMTLTNFIEMLELWDSCNHTELVPSGTEDYFEDIFMERARNGEWICTDEYLILAKKIPHWAIRFHRRHYFDAVYPVQLSDEE